jgi:hypothetical protein
MPPEEGHVNQERRRGQVVDRLTLAGRRHARHFVDQQWSGKPIGPHIVVFFYSEPAQPSPEGIRVATRMFLDDPEVADIARVLTLLHDLALQYSEMGTLHPPSQLANGVEEMSPNAEYLGLGVSTIFPRDDHGSGGSRTRPARLNYGDIPFESIAHLVDGTTLRIACAGGIQPLHLQSTHLLDSMALSTRRWARVPPGFLDADPRSAAVSHALGNLHSVIPRRSEATRQRIRRQAYRAP